MIKYGRVRPRLEIVKIKEQFTTGLSTQLTHRHNDAATELNGLCIRFPFEQTYIPVSSVLNITVSIYPQLGFVFDITASILV